MISIEQLTEFVLEHRGKTVFINMDPEEIHDELLKASRNNSLAWHAENGEVTGIIVLDIDHKNKILFVRRNLNITPRAIIAMCCGFDSNFKEYRLQGLHHTFKEYKDPIRLVSRWASMASRKLLSSNK